MPLKEIRVKNFRAFEDTNNISIGPMLVLIGKNDIGKSCVLHAIKYFFYPPKSGKISIYDIHRKDENRIVQIELAFDPKALSTSQVKLDAKNVVTLSDENLLDSRGLLRFRMAFDINGLKPLEMKIYDFDEEGVFGMAATKKMDELIHMLSARGLKAVAPGKETNEEKRSAIREDCRNRNIKYKEDWIELGDKDKSFRDILPGFIFFEDEARYGIDETPVQTQFKSVVDSVISRMSVAGEIESESNKILQGEFDKIFVHFSNLTDTIERMEAKAKLDWMKLVSRVNLDWIDSFGTSVPFEMRGAGIRRLFMVSYFQYNAAADLLEETPSKYIYAIEEPEVHLHPGAQRLLIDAFQDLCDAGHNILFSTHSPVFASIVDKKSLILVKRENSAARALQLPETSLEDVASELGVEASDRLIGKNLVVLVEGKWDVEFYEESLRLLVENGNVDINPQDILFLQCGGINNLSYMVSMRRMDEAGLKWAVIADSDRKNPGDPIETDLQETFDSRPETCRYFHILKRTTIENYYDPDSVRQVTGLDIEIPKYGPPKHKSNGKQVRGKDYKKLKESAREICKDMGAEKIIQYSLPDESSKPDESEIIRIFQEIKIGFAI